MNTTKPTDEQRADIFARFIEAVEDGETIRQSCKLAGAAWGSISRWITNDTHTLEDGTTYAARYARAREVSAMAFGDKALQAANDATIEDVQVRRLQVDTYKWRAAMANPAAWGDRKQVEHTHLGTLHLAALQAPRTTAHAKLTNANDLAQLASGTEDTPSTDSVQDE